ncbi:excinuclease ABC subunit UvrA [Campylobacter sp. VicNov18]|uniref:excinuclease ABC subunit UvrA n=1 Tax=Campylobacter bilis TaxID=2691918 RepID=UPI00130DD8BA|nr:excinuclease ABC subunit UvrA [Campylobacter bilis]MPV63290.1 excinuclease ABC subunit UvrA [Campylobacter hepaticus]MBM0636789.1 excinuclease ABC subunit UvrA [Campylobacter bilis]MCC8277361.1 excinuclease ABC subunit UvrA [Campylobacter bilis]MCC8299104.1 excinuclease ABC subunit UvrA [Campylobacter bilis]MCC8300270.1 excinuclease ABC subunit UvrA [Campylobacter bilis]
MNNIIKIIGAKENNLKNINLQIPKNKLIVFTGLSGSGKSTLAFGTLYAEGQRRYIESLSAYARQFLDKVNKPDVDKIEGLTPAIAIDQKTTSKNPRSTVGTITEIYDYLRLLYARIGLQHCHQCGKEISSMDASDIVNEILKFPKGSKIIIYAPLVREKKGTYTDLLENLRNKGYVRAQIDGVLVRLDEEIELAKTKKHTIKLVIDRLQIEEDLLSRLASDIEKGLQESFGEIEIEVLNPEEVGLHKHYHFSEHSACFDCKISFIPLEPLSFSFNSPKGACQSCDGLGIRYTLDMTKIINESLSLENGAIKIMYGFNKSYYYKFLIAFCEQNDIPIKIPFAELNEDQKRLVLYGNAKTIEFLWKRNHLKRTFEGVVKMAYEMLKDEKDLAEYMSEKICKDCKGHRLKPESLAVKVAKKGLGEILDMSIEDSTAFFANEENFSYLSEQQKLISKAILKEINERLFFLYDVGLGYLSLGRDARTISGGEAQRIRIASQIGSGLSGVMYVLDEPSIGLHEKDTSKLIKTLRNLQQKGNTLIVVEHDKMTIQEADFIVDIGPKAGKFGGEVVFSGTYKELLKSKSQTALYMNGKKQIAQLQNRPQKEWLELKNININNIKNLNVKFPLQNLVAITGVSGSGKSSLILQTLLPFAQEELNRTKKVKKLGGVQIQGLEKLDKVIYLDQSPIGRTPRSNPATYTGAMDEIRNLFAATKEAKMRGYKAGRFSFNVKGGRCEKCSGDGEIKIEMHFLPDVMVICDTCHGKRYNDSTLEIQYKGKNISEILNMSILEASEFFSAIPKIRQKLDTLVKVGLDYLTLGQNATTLSGGEAQRIKLAKELSRSDTGKTLYILDEPTTGLHFEDVNKLILVLQHLVDLKNSVFVIEHNLDVIKNADYIIDMGPEGGVKGGKVISCGSVEKVAKEHKKTHSYTGYYLDLELQNSKKL